MFQKPDNSFLQSRQRHHSYRNDEFSEVNDLFNKKFRFRFGEDWKIPDIEKWFSEPPWKVKELERLKTTLNYHKSQLNDFNIEEWSSHTRRRNPAGEVGWKIRSVVNPEFLTQAWTKFYECACTYNIVPGEALVDRGMASLHLCEAPGAFITSFNHYLKSRYPDIKWKWLASTLNPYYEGNSPSNMISDDRFMFHTLNNWYFGVDNTGNLMDWDNSQAIIEKAKSLGKVLLVTADGSIDCLQKPDAQEEVTSPLHYCEIVTALQALSTGGTFIFKLFTMFEHSTVNLMYLINHLFGEVNIYKPVTSRQGNSEVYAVCLNYKGSEYLNQYITVLKTAFGTELYGNLSLFPLSEIPESFMKQIEECAYYFCAIQCQVIDNNLYAYCMQNNAALYREMKRLRAVVATEFLTHYGLKCLSAEHEILKGCLHEDNRINTNPRCHQGSYTKRQLYSKMTSKLKCEYLKTVLQTEVLSNPMMLVNEQVKWVCFDEDLKLDIKFTYGYPLKKINSSQFIFLPIFKLYLQIVAEDDFKKIIFSNDCGTKESMACDLDNGGGKKLSLAEFDFKDSYWVYEKSCLKSLVNVLKDLSNEDSVLIQNFSTLTHFNVSILYILSKKCFRKTSFMPNGDIILNHLCNKESLMYIDMISRECDKVSTEEARDVLNSLPVQITNTGDFFNDIVFYNNTFYRNKCMEYILKIEQSLI